MLLKNRVVQSDNKTWGYENEHSIIENVVKGTVRSVSSHVINLMKLGNTIYRFLYLAIGIPFLCPTDFDRTQVGWRPPKEDY